MLSFNLRYVMGVRQSREVKEKLRVETLNTQRQICLVGKWDDRQICRHRAHASIFLHDQNSSGPLIVNFLSSRKVHD